MKKMTSWDFGESIYVNGLWISKLKTMESEFNEDENDEDDIS